MLIHSAICNHLHVHVYIDFVVPFFVLQGAIYSEKKKYVYQRQLMLKSSILVFIQVFHYSFIAIIEHVGTCTCI